MSNQMRIATTIGSIPLIINLKIKIIKQRLLAAKSINNRELTINRSIYKMLSRNLHLEKKVIRVQISPPRMAIIIKSFTNRE